MSPIPLIKLFIILPVLFVYARSDIAKLPYCLENYVPGLVLVSTIDGRFSALNSEGILQWQIETDPGPLLTSNIHNLELTNSGKWVRIIPSLTGALYRFDGLTIDPIPITAESLLKSSFKYSDELVIAGGLEVTTYGVGFRTGKILYTCSSIKCSNNTGNDAEVEDVLLLERSTQTVRAIEPHSGHERWNFSVGHHNIKLPQVSCSDPNANLFNWNLTAIIPDGLLLASNFNDNVETTWQYHFSSPIVRVWKWNGHKISEIDLFSTRSLRVPKEPQLSPSIYIGMHNKQLYIHESDALQHQQARHGMVAETSSLAKIPWKPIAASGLLTEEDSTALSVLYSSEYVNGRGYYLFSESDLKKKDSGWCKNNRTLKFLTLEGAPNEATIALIFHWWKEIIVFCLTTAFVFNLMFRSFARRHQSQNVIFVERHVEVPEKPSSERLSESSDSPFVSRYTSDFDTLRCLGKGGFGVVFEVKQKIDECHYAIKRIVLPNEKKKRETVMREVKALAKLEHSNIVRYFNSWVESPPCGWQLQYDYEWLGEPSEATSEMLTSNPSGGVKLNLTETSSISKNYKLNSETNDSFIVFDDDGDTDKENSCLNSDASNKTDVVSYTSQGTDSRTEHSSGVNWRRPSRRYHSLNNPTNVPNGNPPVFLYIQMQLCQKDSLKEWLVENSDRHFPNMLQIFKQILAAVEYVHLQGLIHRDLKPSNIFFSMDGQIKVGDFGLVKDVEESLDVPHSNTPAKGHTKEVGTRLYMSPEQVNGEKYNYKVDIYSLGLIFYELLVYFSTDMERIQTLTKLRDHHFSKEFTARYPEEHELLALMLCRSPEKRPTTFGIRSRPPINCCDGNYNKAFDFDLPKSIKSTVKQM